MLTANAFMACVGSVIDMGMCKCNVVVVCVCLCYAFVDIMNRPTQSLYLCISGPLALSPSAKLQWLGFTDEGILATHDSRGIIRVCVCVCVCCHIRD